MASRNRQVVEELIRRMNVRDTYPTHLFHPDIEWHWARAAPGATLFRGRDGVIQGLETWVESWDELAIEPWEFLEEGDYVLALMTYRMRGAGSGVHLEEPVAHLHQFEAGLVRRWWMFGDADKAKRRFLAGDRPG